MKIKSTQILTFLLAAFLQVAPVLRAILPAQGLAPSAWSCILKIGIGAVALLGFDAVSQASSISISPATATVGQPYTGVITYSGSHAGSVQSMTLSNNCLSGSAIGFFDGLTISYNGVNQALVSGTPTAAVTNLFTLKVWSGTGCGGSHSDSRATTLTIVNSGGSGTVPSFTSLPQNAIAQIGSDVVLSSGAVGNPLPKYYWKQGLNFIPGGTNNSLTIPAVQLTNCGLYSVIASNTSGTVSATCYLTVCQTPGTNILALNYTNYYPAANSLTMFSIMTNVPAAANSYQWSYNNNASGFPATSNLTLAAASVLPTKSGTYSIIFTSTVGTNTIVSPQQYDSYWAFGYPPVFTNSLPATASASPGSSVTFNLGVGGSLNVYYALNTPNTNSGGNCVFWYKDGSLVAAQSYVVGPVSTASYVTSAVTASLTLPNVTSANAGSYTVVVTNFWGSITSSPVALNVASSLAVTAPASLTNYAGNSFSLAVNATGSAPLNYQWLKGSAYLANGGTVTGAGSNVLNIAPAALGDSGNYSVIVTNSSGSVTSGVAVVLIVPAPSITASPGGGNLSVAGSGGIANRLYIVEATTNLAGQSGWQPLQTNLVSANGSFTFTDTNAPVFNQRFYHVKFP